MKTTTIQDLMAYLRVSRMTVHRMRQANELPPTIPTGRNVVRWLTSDIELWLELGCPSASEFQALKKTKRKFAKR